MRQTSVIVAETPVYVLVRYLLLGNLLPGFRLLGLVNRAICDLADV